MENSITISAGKRTYFLDIKKSREGRFYLTITESKRNSQGDYQRYRVMIFEEHFPILFDGISKLAPKLGVKLDSSNYIDIVRRVHINAYRAWSAEDDKNLEILFCEGRTIKQLSEIFKRKSGAIRSRIKKLNLKEKYDN